MAQPARSFATAAARWAGVGPYYAMFPVAFADDVVLGTTRTGDCVLDPFAGRGTAIFSAAVHGRHGIGVELNPVGWIYARTKLDPASEVNVLHRLAAIGRSADQYQAAAAALPPFFHHCFTPAVRTFLLAARAELNWLGR